jgi:hypothetical protein
VHYYKTNENLKERYFDILVADLRHTAGIDR